MRECFFKMVGQRCKLSKRFKNSNKLFNEQTTSVHFIQRVQFPYARGRARTAKPSRPKGVTNRRIRTAQPSRIPLCIIYEMSRPPESVRDTVV
jgi:hypothetical protein